MVLVGKEALLYLIRNRAIVATCVEIIIAGDDMMTQWERTSPYGHASL